MPATGPHYWPFPVLPEEQLTEQHRKEVRFLEEAHAAGFRPCKFMDGEYQVHVEEGRYGWIICRGGFRKGNPTRWEIWLDDQSGRAAACWVNDFDSAAASVLSWLREGDLSIILEAIAPNVIRGPAVNSSHPAARS